jgi:hypothetical protein
MARFFHCGLTKQELMKRAFRIKPVASNIPRDLEIPEDLRQKHSRLHFVQPGDLEIGTMDDNPILGDPADMLTPLRTVPLELHAGGDFFMPVISEILAAVPADLLPAVTAFSVDRDRQQPHSSNGHQRALVTYYTGELPQKMKDQYIICDGRAYSPHRQLMEELEKIPVIRPLKLKGPGR